MRFLYTFTFVFLLLTPFLSKAQCNIDALASPMVICEGDSVRLRSFGACNYLMNNDFNNQSLGVGWSSTAANPVFTNPCGPGPSGAHAWVGTTASSTRTLETQTYNVSIGGCKVDFYMRYGLVPNSGACEDPDASNEGVHLQYSINNGSTWQDFPGPNLNPSGPNSTSAPFVTVVDGQGGYWQPESSGSVQLTSNLYYWHHYSCPVPPVASTNSTKFRWAQLSSSSTGYDAWGIDEVEILCPDTNAIVEWRDQSGNIFSTVFMAGYVHPAQSQWYYVTITDTVTGDSATDSIYITVNPKPSAEFAVSDSSICAGDSVQFQYAGNASSSATFEWDFSGTPQTGMGPYTHTFPDDGMFAVGLEVEENGCRSLPYFRTIYVHPHPMVSFIPDQFRGCEPLEVNFTNFSTPAQTQFTWDFGDGNSSTQESPTHNYTTPGLFDVTLYAVTAEGCTDSVIIPELISVFQNPIADFASDYYLLSFKNPTVNLTNLSMHADSLFWDFGDGTNSNSMNPGSHTFPGDGTYTVCLYVETVNGCKDELCKDIQIVVDEIKIPNVITPNDDGHNEKFEIENIEKLQSSYLVIYNRWGKKVFESSNYQNDWNAEGYADGVYFWVLDYKTMLGDEERVNGTLTVLRE